MDGITKIKLGNKEYTISLYSGVIAAGDKMYTKLYDIWHVKTGASKASLMANHNGEEYTIANGIEYAFYAAEAHGGETWIMNLAESDEVLEAFAQALIEQFPNKIVIDV